MSWHILDRFDLSDLRSNDGFTADVFFSGRIEARENERDVVDDVVVFVVAGEAMLFGCALKLLAKQCAAQADEMQPGPERDALLAKARQYRSYAKMENWIASKELQRPVS